jgi:hypothetical protein
MKPQQTNTSWHETGLTRAALTQRDINVLLDHDGVECQLFRAHTSGLVLLYEDSGKLLFQGGITPSRGHEGANDGVAALESILQDGPGPIHRHTVFGCPIQTPALALREQ